MGIMRWWMAAMSNKWSPRRIQCQARWGPSWNISSTGLGATDKEGYLLHWPRGLGDWLHEGGISWKNWDPHVIELKMVFYHQFAWWCHGMEMLSVLLALCEGNPSVTGGNPHKGPVMQILDIFFVVSPNKLLNKQWICQWFEMHYHWYNDMTLIGHVYSCPLWQTDSLQ